MNSRVIVRYSRDLAGFAAWRAERESRSATPADRQSVARFIDDRVMVSALQIGELTATQTRLLLNLAQVGLAVTRGARASIRAERVDELREFLATRPAVRNVAELRALPDLPKSAKRLSD